MLDLLIINAHSDEFYYVPMGSIAICTYLRRHGMRAQVLNLATTPRQSVRAKLEETLLRTKPRLVGLVFHWKETLNAVIAAGDVVQQLCPGVPIVAGGLTASCDPAEWLLKLPYLTYVVQGDAEVPLRELCRGTPPGAIPNLYHRGEDGIRAPRTFWTADAAFLDELEYGDLGVVLDSERYIKLMNSRLGMPLALGRGCVHDCGYCGGSRSAFALHSHREGIALRNPQSILRDIEAALSTGENTFLLSHLSIVCTRALKAISERFGESPPFSVNLEIWGQPSRAAINAYSAVKWRSTEHGRFLLLTARGDADPSRARAEQAALIKCAREAATEDPDLYITVFTGYFAPWHSSRARLDEELRFSVEVRKEMCREGRRITLALMTLSTDPKSRWERSAADLGLVGNSELSSLTRGGLDVSSVTNNLILHTPSALTSADKDDFLRSWHLDEQLQMRAPAAWTLLVNALSFADYRAVLSVAARSLYFERNGTVYPAGRLGPAELIASARAAIGTTTLTADRRCVLESALALLIAEVRASSNQPHLSDRQPLDEGTLPVRLVVDPEAVIYSPYDLDALLKPGSPTPPNFLIDQCHAAAVNGRGYVLRPSRSEVMPPEEMSLLNRFDGLVTTGNLVDAMANELGAPRDAILRRVATLVRAQVLMSVEP